jgi:hypothetical protein
MIESPNKCCQVRAQLILIDRLNLLNRKNYVLFSFIAFYFALEVYADHYPMFISCLDILF